MVNKPQNAYPVLINNWPNFISLARLLSAPVIIWLILTDRMMLAFITCVVAGFSDLLDGYLARILSSPSKIGAILDPIADKILLVGLYLTLGYKGVIPQWLVGMVILRDLAIVGGAVMLHALHKPFTVQPILISKINTLLQIFTVVWVLLQVVFLVHFPLASNILFIMVAVTTVASAASYTMVWLRSMWGENNAYPS